MSILSILKKSWPYMSALVLIASLVGVVSLGIALTIPQNTNDGFWKFLFQNPAGWGALPVALLFIYVTRFFKVFMAPEESDKEALQSKNRMSYLTYTVSSTGIFAVVFLAGDVWGGFWAASLAAGWFFINVHPDAHAARVSGIILWLQNIPGIILVVAKNLILQGKVTPAKENRPQPAKRSFWLQFSSHLSLLLLLAVVALACGGVWYTGRLLLSDFASSPSPSQAELDTIKALTVGGAMAYGWLAQVFFTFLAFAREKAKWDASRRRTFALTAMGAVAISCLGPFANLPGFWAIEIWGEGISRQQGIMLSTFWANTAGNVLALSMFLFVEIMRKAKKKGKQKA